MYFAKVAASLGKKDASEEEKKPDTKVVNILINNMYQENCYNCDMTWIIRKILIALIFYQGKT